MVKITTKTVLKLKGVVDVMFSNQKHIKLTLIQLQLGLNPAFNSSSHLD